MQPENQTAGSIEKRKRLTRLHKVVFLFVLFIHAALVVYQDCWNSPNVDEVGHLPAGVAVWKYGRHDMYSVNPPLVKTIASLPAAFEDVKVDWSRDDRGSFRRPEWDVGKDFINANADDWFRWFQYGRLMLLPLSLLGGIVCFLWARELYGNSSGLVAFVMWCFSPNVLAWGASITPDMAATSLGLLASWLFWRWLKSPGFLNAFLAGMGLGIVELAKMSWIILFVLWPLLWILWKAIHSDASSFQIGIQPTTRKPVSTKTELGQLCLILMLGLFLLNAGYGFQGSFTPVEAYTFGTRTLAGKDNSVDNGPGGNRFRGTVLGKVPVPLPKDYVQGIDLQKLDFERMRPCFFEGQWRERGGWWHFYLVGTFYKEPAGYLAMGGLALLLTCLLLQYRQQWRDELLLLIPGVALLILISSQTGFTIYLRYVLPVYPFFYICVSKVVQPVPHTTIKTPLLLTTAVLLSWSIYSSLAVYPHSLSFANEFAGGPENGYRHLPAECFDFGQNLFYLKSWYEEHPEARPCYFRLPSNIDRERFSLEPDHWPDRNHEGRLPSGWYVVSTKLLFARNHMEYQTLLENHDPVEKIGQTLWIYHITEEED